MREKSGFIGDPDSFISQTSADIMRTEMPAMSQKPASHPCTAAHFSLMMDFRNSESICQTVLTAQYIRSLCYNTNRTSVILNSVNPSFSELNITRGIFFFFSPLWYACSHTRRKSMLLQKSLLLRKLHIRTEKEKLILEQFPDQRVC